MSDNQIQRFARPTHRSMAFRPNHSAKSSVKVLTAADVVDRLLDVQFVQSAEKRQCIDGAVQETRVNFSPLVAGEDT